MRHADSLVGAPELKFIGALPGVAAQASMASAGYLPRLLEDVPPGAVDAAVLALLTPVNQGRSPEELLDWRVLLIRRNIYPGAHSGQISFPGGRAERCDGCFWSTACRETFEEVGISEADIRPAGPLTNLYVGSSNFLIHPFAAVGRGTARRAAPGEVADFKNIPLRALNPAKAERLDFQTGSGLWLDSPAWRHEDFIIWGATAMILAELYQAVTGAVLVRA